jgi:hypothetical protein
LYFGSQQRDLAAVLVAGGRDMKGQQMPPGIDRPMHLRASPAFGAVIAC